MMKQCQRHRVDRVAPLSSRGSILLFVSIQRERGQLSRIVTAPIAVHVNRKVYRAMPQTAIADENCGDHLA